MGHFFDLIVLVALGTLGWKQRQRLRRIAGRIYFVCGDFRYEFRFPPHPYNERLLRRALRMIVARFHISATGLRTLPTTAKVLVHPEDAARLNLVELRDQIQSSLADELENLGKQNENRLIAPPLIVVDEDTAAARGFPLVDPGIESPTSLTMTSTVVSAGGDPEQDEEADMTVVSDPCELRAVTAGFSNLLLSTDEPLTGGRSTRLSDLQVLEEKVSRQHFRIYPLDGRLWIEDLNSQNGTWLNGHKVKEPTALSDGDRLQVGRVEFELHEGDLPVSVGAAART
jgi:hypothetical protein